MFTNCFICFISCFFKFILHKMPTRILTGFRVCVNLLVFVSVSVSMSVNL